MSYRESEYLCPVCICHRPSPHMRRHVHATREAILGVDSLLSLIAELQHFLFPHQFLVSTEKLPVLIMFCSMTQPMLHSQSFLSIILSHTHTHHILTHTHMYKNKKAGLVKFNTPKTSFYPICSTTGLVHG